MFQSFDSQSSSASGRTALIISEVGGPELNGLGLLDICCGLVSSRVIVLLLCIHPFTFF